MMTQLAPLALIGAIFYFLLIRPQQKRAKQHQEMLKALKRGDQVVTNGGLIGRVARIEGDGVLVLEVAPNVKVKVKHSMIADINQRSETRDEDKDDKGDDDKADKKSG